MRKFVKRKKFERAGGAFLAKKKKKKKEGRSCFVDVFSLVALTSGLQLVE
jgi:hypothetical protein